jgi:AraC-like DNA-binding protein
VLLEGTALLQPHDGSGVVTLVAGDAVLLTPSDASKGRFEDASYLDLEWLPNGANATAGLISRLQSVDLSRAEQLGARLVANTTPDRELFAEAFAFFGGIGAPLGALTAEGLSSSPSERDLAIARAITTQIADLRSASALALGEHAELSPRQLQRTLTDYFDRYRMNAFNWRDMRNRYRIQIAIALLSIRELSIATIADEVGFASPAALARAFGALGLPTPGELRAELERMFA